MTKMYGISRLLIFSAVLISCVCSFAPLTTTDRKSLCLYASGDEEKFGFGQRIASAQSGVIGALSGSIAGAPFLAFHDNGLAQWEFDTDAAALEGALFAIVYRYCVRQDDNPQLNQGVVGAFVVVRTLSRLKIPEYCTALPLQCGSPLGYLDWAILSQIAVNGIESAIIFGAAASAVDWAMEKKFLSKFPG